MPQPTAPPLPAECACLRACVESLRQQARRTHPARARALESVAHTLDDADIRLALLFREEDVEEESQPGKPPA